MVDRNPVTVIFFPEKLTVEEFVGAITDEKANQAFIDNMNHLHERNPKSRSDKEFAEIWIQTYAAWMEMND